MEEANPKRLPAARFRLQDLLEKAEPGRQERDQRLPGAGEGEGGTHSGSTEGAQGGAAAPFDALVRDAGGCSLT